MEIPKHPMFDFWLPNTVYVYGLETQQWPADIFLISAILRQENIKSVTEIGTLRGGLTTHLALESIQRGFKLLSMDINPSEMFTTPLGKILQPHFTFILEDCFQTPEIQRWIDDPDLHPMLFLCDGGNKPKEFSTFGKKLWAGDVVGAHDYGYEFLPEHAKEGESFGIYPYFPTGHEISYWYWGKKK